MAPQSRMQYKVSYPGYKEATLNLIPSLVEMAQGDDWRYQYELVHHYFKALEQKMPSSWRWSLFSITPTGKPGRPPRRPRTQKKMQ